MPGERLPQFQEPPVRVMALHSLAYCERLYYLEEVEGQLVADAAVHDGRRLHEGLDQEGALTAFTLEAPELGLRGRVDAVRSRGGVLIPIEVKKGRCAAGGAAWPSDRIQVGAYALLLEQTQGVSIAEGRVRYLESGKTVRVSIDLPLRQQVRDAILRARTLRREVDRPPVTDNPRLCPRCSLAPVCLPEEERRARDAEHRPVRLFLPHGDRMVLHVLEHGSRVGCKGNRLTVTMRSEVPEQSYAIHQVESVVVHGYGQISTQALRLCSQHDVAVQWMTGSGDVTGVMQPATLSAQRQIRQFEALRDPATRMRLARLLIEAKVHAQLHYLMRGHRGDERREVQELLARVRRGLRDTEAADSPEQLLGIEGSAAAAYFEGLGLLLGPEVDPRLRYERRSKRPALDRFNGVLNYLYGMLHRQVRASVLSVGLHPGFGFYHQPRSAAPPLVLDLMELFRVPMVDMALVAAINRGTFDPDQDFEGSSLTPDGRAKAIEVFERRKQEEWKHPVVGYSLSYARTIELEVRLLEKELNGEGRLFARFRLR